MWIVLAGCVAACGAATPKPRSAPDLSPASLYPLGAGYAWSYDVDTGDGQSTLAVARVIRFQDGMAEVVTGADGVMHYVLRPDGIARAASGYLLKAPVELGASWSSGEGTSARVTAMHEQLRSAAGSFSECVVVEEQNTGSGQHITTTYCPGVGPAQVVSEMQVRGQNLRVTARLRGYTLEAPEAVASESRPAETKAAPSARP